MEATPSKQEIEAALERILASQYFSQAARTSAFLRFVVGETLAGRSDRLKGYTIATQVFDKPADFDAQADPYVRVEAGRLRQRLAEYYLAEGATDTVRIEVKRGAYAPEFSYATAGIVPNAVVTITGRRRRSARRRMLLGVVVVAVVGAIVALGVRQGARETVAVVDRTPRIRIEAFENIGAAEFDYFAYGLAEEVLVRLGRRLDFRAFYHYDIRQGDSTHRLVVEDADPDYILTGTVTASREEVRVTARLVDARSQQQLWADRYSDAFDVSRLLSIQENIANEVVSAIADPLGPIPEAETARVLQLPLETLDAYDCRLRYTYALRTLSATAQAPAKQCLERFATADWEDATGWAILSMLYRWEYEGGYDLIDNTAPAIERAREAARRALDLDGNNASAHEAMGLIRLVIRDYDGARASTERALQLDPPAAMRASLGLNLIRLGEGERGMSMIEDALRESTRAAPYFFSGPAIYYMSLRDYDQALQWAARIDAPDFIIGQVLVAALAAHAGQVERAERAVERIQRIHPRFAEYKQVLIGRWELSTAEETLLTEDLEIAGVRLD